MSRGRDAPLITERRFRPCPSHFEVGESTAPGPTQVYWKWGAFGHSKVYYTVCWYLAQGIMQCLSHSARASALGKSPDRILAVRTWLSDSQWECHMHQKNRICYSLVQRDCDTLTLVSQIDIWTCSDLRNFNTVFMDCHLPKIRELLSPHLPMLYWTHAFLHHPCKSFSSKSVKWKRPVRYSVYFCCLSHDQTLYCHWKWLKWSPVIQQRKAVNA